jgi:hypothetical protein
MIEVTFDNELNNIVYQKVKRGEYPEPTPLIPDDEQRKEIEDLKFERIPRPATKMGYFNRIRQLEAQRADIRAQNDQIDLDNKAARKAVDDKFLADIENAKKDPENIRAAEVAVLVYKKSIEQASSLLVSEGKITSQEKTDHLAKFEVSR